MPSLRRLLDRGLSFAREAASLVAGAARDAVRSRRSLVIENAALRRQFAVLKGKAPKPQLRDRDRWFWIAMRRFHGGWRAPACSRWPSAPARS